jgi:hypothetical protein
LATTSCPKELLPIKYLKKQLVFLPVIFVIHS